MFISAGNNLRPWQGAAFLLSTAAMVFATGCTVGPDFSAPVVPTISQYTTGTDPRITGNANDEAQTFETSSALPADWWMLFSSPQMNEAIKTGLIASPSIASAEATLRQANDQLRSGEGIFYPQVNGGFSASRQQPSTNANPLRFQEGTFNLFTLSASVSYALDIFGGERREVEGLSAAVDYQRNSAHAASLTLASNIANLFIALAAYNAEIDATNEIIALEKKQVDLASAQTRAGTGSYAAQLSLEAQLEASQAGLPALRQKVTQAQNLLAVLEGKSPAEWEPPAISFDELALPRKIPVSLPSALVRQRPDILEAESSLHIASAEIGVATAAMFPSITLSGEAGYSDTAASSMFSGPSGLWSLGAGVAQPIFNGGTLHYRRQAAIDAYDAAAADYRQIVLSAFQQVADSLRGLEHDADSLAVAERAVATAKRSLEIVQANYSSGLAPYSDVLIADMQYRQARIVDIQDNAARYQDTVALFAALGGGWWNNAQKQGS